MPSIISKLLISSSSLLEWQRGILPLNQSRLDLLYVTISMQLDLTASPNRGVVKRRIMTTITTINWKKTTLNTRSAQLLIAHDTGVMQTLHDYSLSQAFVCI